MLRSSRARTALAAVGLAIVILAAACASEPAPAGRLVPLTLSEFAFAPKELSLKAGELVTLEVRNRGQVQHEIMAGSGTPEHEGYANDLFAGVDLKLAGTAARDHAHRGAAIIVAPGKTARATFTVPDRKGAYEIGCFEPGHYAAGMVGRLIVQ